MVAASAAMITMFVGAAVFVHRRQKTAGYAELQTDVSHFCALQLSNLLSSNSPQEYILPPTQMVSVGDVKTSAPPVFETTPLMAI